MDTRFWGPSGWRLLHLISFQAPRLPKESLHTFFELLPFVLPCKYCRASLTDYYAADPIPQKAAEYPEWMYRIHNRVSGKLREQKLIDTPDPNWSEIEKRYGEWIKAPCSTQRLIGWDFFFSVAFTTPSPTVASRPMPGSPPKEVLHTPELKNRWNVLTREERLPYIQKWWRSLGDVLPFPEWQAVWSAMIQTLGQPPVQQGRRKVTAWLYQMERGVCSRLKEATPHTSFEGLCSELSAFTSGCGTAKRSKTCRATKRTARKRLTHRRKYQYKATGGFL